MDFQEITIEAISDTGIKYDGSWVTVTGNAVNFLSQFKNGDVVSLGFESGKVVYIKRLETNKNTSKVESKPTTFKKSNLDATSERILAQSTLKEAVQIAISSDNTHGNIIDKVKAVHKDLFYYMVNEEYKK